jgi:hypothetical protein
VGLLTAERHEVFGTSRSEQDVAVGHGPHGDVRHERMSLGRRNGDRDRVRPRERRTAVGMGQTTWRRRGDDRDEARLGEAARPGAEHARRKAGLRDDEARSLRWVGEDAVADGRERDIAERPLAVPALEPVGPLDPIRPGDRVARGLQQADEPGDAGEPVTRAAGSVCGGEMADDDLGVPLREAARLERAERLVPRHEGDPKGSTSADRVSDPRRGVRLHDPHTIL